MWHGTWGPNDVVFKFIGHRGRVSTVETDLEDELVVMGDLRSSLNQEGFKMDVDPIATFASKYHEVIIMPYRGESLGRWIDSKPSAERVNRVFGILLLFLNKSIACIVLVLFMVISPSTI